MTSIELLKDIQENYDWERAVFFKGYFETIKEDLDKLEKLKNEIQTRIGTLQKRQEYLNNCLGTVECFMEYNFNIKKLELLSELKEVLENDR